MKRLGAALLLGLALGGPSRASAGPLLPEECQQRIAELRATFARVEARPAESVALPASRPFTPPMAATGLSPRGLSAIVERSAGAMLVDGHPMPVTGGGPALVAAVVAEIEAGQRRRRLIHDVRRVPRARLGLWVDGAIPAHEAVALLRGLGERYEVGLLAMKSLPPRRAPPAKLPQRLEVIQATTDPARKLALVSEATGSALAGCPGHERSLREEGASGVEGERRLHEAILGAVTACSCAGVDFELLTALAEATEEPASIYLGPLRVRTRAKIEVRLARDATTQDLVERLPPGAGEVAVTWMAAAARPGSP